jgi:hypothetical protein
MLKDKLMKYFGLPFILFVFLTYNSLPSRAQSLAELAKREGEKREKQKVPSKVYTNEDLGKYEIEIQAPSASGESSAQPENTPSVRFKSEPGSSSEEEERAWSRRFMEVKTKLQEAKNHQETLQAKLNDLNLKLMRQADVYDREHLYGPLIAQTREEMDRNRNEISAAESTLEQLREDLRKNGRPSSWENSQLALRPISESKTSDAPKLKDQKYWQDQLTVLEKRFDALTAPLESERFQLIHRRPPKEGEADSPAAGSGMGLPPRVIDIEVQLKELHQKHQQEKNALIDQAIREGALPGWFR